MEKLQHIENVRWELPKAALKKWDGSICAANNNEENVIDIYDTIGGDWLNEGITAKSISTKLQNMEGDITVNINSPGGSMFEGLAIYNVLRDYDGNVNVKVIGLAASAASIIAMAGDNIQIAKAGFFMIHNAWVAVIGDKNDFDKLSSDLSKFDAAMNSLYSDHTGISLSDITKMMDEETWIGAEEAIEKGFANELLPKDKTKKDSEKAEVQNLRILDVSLAMAGYSRSERREIIKDVTNSKPSAANVTPSADPELFNALEELLIKLKK